MVIFFHDMMFCWSTSIKDMKTVEHFDFCKVEIKDLRNVNLIWAEDMLGKVTINNTPLLSTGRWHGILTLSPLTIYGCASPSPLAIFE